MRRSNECELEGVPVNKILRISLGLSLALAAHSVVHAQNVETKDGIIQPSPHCRRRLTNTRAMSCLPRRLRALRFTTK